MASAIRSWYRRAEVGTIKSARFNQPGIHEASSFSVEVLLGQNVPDAQEARSYMQNIQVLNRGESVKCSVPFDISGAHEHVRAASFSQQHIFAAYNDSSNQQTSSNSGNSGSVPTSHINIINSHGSIRTISSKKYHGKVLTQDSTFGGIAFTSNEDVVYYVAVIAPPQKTTWWDDTNESEVSGDHSTKYQVVDDWGEAHADITQTAIFRWNWKEDDSVPVKVAIEMPDIEAKTLGNVAIAGDRLIFIAYENGAARRLGVQYCVNRLTSICASNLDGKNMRQISKSGVHSCLFPRVSPDGKRVVWLQTEANGPHKRAGAIVCHDFESDHTEAISPSTFYVGALREHCWLSNTEIAFSHIVHSQLVISIVNCETKDFHTLSRTQDIPGVWSLQDVSNRHLLVSFSSPSQPKGLYYVTVDEDATKQEWITLIKPENTTGIRFQRYETNDGSQDVLVILPPEEKTDKKKSYPTIVVPHGGPHSAAIMDYYALYAAFAYGGFATVFPNYRGSLGFSDEILQSLPGKCGTQDVQDCIELVDLAFAKEPSLDASRMLVFGGSHGGFLTAHLTAQFPDKFRAAALRNPVTDISAMVYVTDIPEWCFVEAGLPIKPVSSITADDLAAMKLASPLPFAHQVKAPSLILVGAKDLRVPPFQGHLWYNALRENNVETKLYCYPEDSHPLASVPCSSDVFVNVASWFSRFL